MGLMNKVEYIDGKINEIKGKLDIPMSSSLQEVVDSVGKFNTQEKTVRPETSNVYVSPDKGYDGLSRVTVSPIKAAYIEDLKPEIIKNGAKVLEMTGTYGPTSQVKNVFPSRLTQKIYPDSGIEYLSMVQVQGVNYTIDDSIQPQNIRKGVEILGITGNYEATVNVEELTVNPDVKTKTYKPPSNVSGYSPVVVNAVTSSIDENIKPENIRQEVSILGVTGTYAPAPMQANKYITPTTNETEYYPDEGYGSFEKVTVRAISASLDPDLKSSNIRRGVDIFGVRGIVDELKGTTLNIIPNKESQDFRPETTSDGQDSGYNGYTRVTVEPVTSNIDENIKPENIKAGVNILGVDGIYVGDDTNLQEKTVTPNDTTQEITYDEGYVGLGKVTVNPVLAEERTVSPSYQAVVVEKINNTYLSKVTVNPVDSSVDGNIKPENIKQNISILGVVGTYAGENPQEIFGPISAGNSSSSGLANAIINIPNGLIFSNTNANYAFYNLKITAVPSIDFSKITTLDHAFSGCTQLVDISNLVNLNNVVSMKNLFSNCDFKSGTLSSFPDLNSVNHSIDCTGLIYRCINVDDLSFLQKIDKVIGDGTRMCYLGRNETWTVYINTNKLNLDFQRATNLKDMFHGVSVSSSNSIYTFKIHPSLKTLANFLGYVGFSNVEVNIEADEEIKIPMNLLMQYNNGSSTYRSALKQININPNIKPTTLSSAFYYTSFGQGASIRLNLDYCTSLENTFCFSSNLTSVIFDGKSINMIDASYCFGSSDIESVSNIYFDSCKNVHGIFYNCTNLKNINGFYNIGKAFNQKKTNYFNYFFDLSDCPNITHDSIVSIIDGLYDLNISYGVATGGVLYRQKFGIHPDVLSTLTEEEKNLITSKGWNIVTS